jgi:alkanesulfonate monooxygenase SsuD/methylene tetrahydromethanopterin reductase-like flavin-dependent oxidoreductase (luciferase family)
MNRMKYTCSITAVAIDELIEIAKTAEEVGFDSIARVRQSENSTTTAKSMAASTRRSRFKPSPSDS